MDKLQLIQDTMKWIQSGHANKDDVELVKDLMKVSIAITKINRRMEDRHETKNK